MNNWLYNVSDRARRLNSIRNAINVIVTLDSEPDRRALCVGISSTERASKFST